MKKTPPPQSLSSSTITKGSLSAPAVLLALLHVMSVVCSGFTFSSWTLTTWIVFIPFYILLWITSILYVIHWHRKKNLEEEEKKEQIRAARRKRIDESDKQTEDCNLERDTLSAQEECLKMLLHNPNLSGFSCDDNPLLGKNVHIEFEKSGKNTTDNTPSKIRAINNR